MATMVHLPLLSKLATMVHCNLLPLLSTLLFLLSLPGPLCCGASEYYVKPTEDTPCPSEPCHTLIEYAENATHYFTSVTNVTFLFLPGVHPLNISLTVANDSNVSFQALPTAGSNVIILSSNAGTFAFSNTLNLTIEHLIFSMTSLHIYSITNLKIVGVTLEKGQSFIYAKNVLGHSEITNLTIYNTSYNTFGFPMFYLWYEDIQSTTNIPTSNHLVIQDSRFLDSNGIAIIVYTTQTGYTAKVDIVQVHINRIFNIIPTGYLESTVEIYGSTPVIFTNTTFEDNVNINPITATSIISLASVNHVGFVDCSFHGNIGTPIVATNSTFHVSGNMSFVNNTGQKGGAMAFYGGSQIIIDNPDHTHILFQNNYAMVGGAIFVDQGYNLVFNRYTDSYGKCFISFNCTAQVSQILLNFTNNTAQYGGNAIYGATLETCNSVDLCGLILARDIEKVSHFEPSEDISRIASPPSRVCLCDKDGKPDCASSVQSIYPPPMYHYPGETFTISAVVVGDEFGTVNGSIYARFFILNKNRAAPQFRALQEAQRVGHSSCTSLKYSVLSENASEIIVLTVGETVVDSFAGESVVEDMILSYELFGYIYPQLLPLLSLPVYLNITLLLCPLGFTLASPPGECVCNKQMQENNITCNINDQTLHRSGTIWINASPANDGVIIAKYCPFDYCRSENVAVNLSNPDSQCGFNHSGILCGGCQPGLSLTLGSSQCRSCSNTYMYLVLIVSFAIAGIALVFFIKVLNLTVSKGTINGLIFYANIVGAVPSSFFPAGAINFLTVFIAWLNLDLGIETCFFDGLDTYWKTWLQFVFPAYIWAIIGLIIFLSRLSHLATKIFGNNSADVLATLLLLSYAKLFRTIISALSFSFLKLPDGTRVAVWSLDGNIPYLSGKHIPLFLVALAVLLLLWLPFTAVLLFWQLLQRVTHYKIMWIVRWIVVKKKPFFDTYFGPLKGEHRYWVGVLLLVRGILLIIFAVGPIDATGVHLLSISTVTTVLLTYLSTLSGRCYNSWYLSLLENSFILNLGVLSAATIYVHSSGGNQAAVVYTSVGIVFVQFVGIICYHVFFSLRKWWKNRKERADGELQDINRAEYERIDDEPLPIRSGPLLRVDFSEYREPVLGHFD